MAADMVSDIAIVQSGSSKPAQGPGIGLSGETQVVFIIGDPIAQVKSPSLLSARFAARGVNTLVVPGHVAPADVAGFMTGLDVLQNAPGLVITVPHKQAVLPYCARVTERARYAGSVNVMRRIGQDWIGDNTDGMGYVNGIKAAGGTTQGQRVLLIGAGGAGCAIGYEFLAQGAAHLAVHDVDAARRDGFIARLSEAFPGQVSVGSDDPSGFDIVANATPLGMRQSDPMPVQIDKLTDAQFAACPITKPEISPFIAAAQAKGCKTMPGIGMFRAQEELLVDALLHLEA
jgi:shikimate dehydrogenase